MWPTIGPLRTYGILYLIGIVLHFVVGWCVARRHGLKHRVWIVASLCYLLSLTQVLCIAAADIALILLITRSRTVPAP